MCQPLLEEVCFKIQEVELFRESVDSRIISRITTGIPWEVCSVRTKFNPGAIVYPGFLTVMMSMVRRLLVAAQRDCLFLKLQSFKSGHALLSAATEESRMRLKWPCNRAGCSWLALCCLFLQWFLAVVTSRLPYRAEKKETLPSLCISSLDKLLFPRHPKCSLSGRAVHSMPGWPG